MPPVRRVAVFSACLLSVLLTATALPAVAEPVVEGRLLPSPRVTVHDGDAWSINSRGRWEMDFVGIDDDREAHSGGIYDRRLRFGFDAQRGPWAATMEVDLANQEDSEFTDVVLEYDAGAGNRVQLGHFKEYFGMERTDSSAPALFNERAAIDTFTPQRNLGVQYSRYGERGSASFGVFTDSMVSNSKKDHLGLTSRVTYSFPFEERHLLHVGGSGSVRWMDTVGFSYGPDTEGTDSVIGTSRLYDADTLWQGGVEAAYAWQNLLVEGEYMRSRLERDSNPTVEFDGWYVSAGWMLTGEQRPYSAAKEAVFGSFAPDKPFDLRNGTWGAWEVMARYQAIDLNDRNVRGGAMDGYTAGLSWYLNEQWRVSGNVSWLDVTERPGLPDDEPVVYTLRVRVLY
jgi:phosphate-selective porin OprO and OprP